MGYHRNLGKNGTTQASIRRKRLELRKSNRLKRRRRIFFLVFACFAVFILSFYLYSELVATKKSKQKKNTKVVILAAKAKAQSKNHKEVEKKDSKKDEGESTSWGTARSLEFARLGNLSLFLPANYPELMGIGFHQASNPKTFPLEPVEPYLKDRSEATTTAALPNQKEPLLFVMASRGRGHGPTTAADIAFKPDTVFESPVDGVVTRSESYVLYGRYQDWRVDIEPAGHPELRVVMIHLDGVSLKVGDRVKARKTPIGKPRALSTVLNPQINRYLPGCEHVHFQINPPS